MSILKEEAIKVSQGSNDSYLEIDDHQRQKIQRKFSKIEKETIQAAME